jgi:hypothetical protein
MSHETHSTHSPIPMNVSTLPDRPAGSSELGVVYASVEGVNDHSFDECLAQLTHKAHALGATALVGMQLVQSQFQWNQRTSLLATAIKLHEVGAGSAPHS